MSAAYEIQAVEYLGGFRLRLTFADGLVFDLDLEQKLSGKVGSIFEPLRDPEFFAKAFVDPGLGTVVWPNGADLAPDALHEQAARVA